MWLDLILAFVMIYPFNNCFHLQKYSGNKTKVKGVGWEPDIAEMVRGKELMIIKVLFFTIYEQIAQNTFQTVAKSAKDSQINALDIVIHVFL